MKLKQNSTFKNFFQTPDNTGFLVFTDDISNTDFDFTKAFTSYQFRFLIIFFKAIVPIDDELRTRLQKILTDAGNNNKIMWVDKLGSTDLNNVFNITIDAAKKNLATEHSLFNRGVDINKVIIKTMDDNGAISSSIRFDNANSQLLFSVSPGKSFKLIANGGQENVFDKFVIPLVHASSLLGFQSKASGNNIGAVCFSFIGQNNNAVQPKTSLISPGKNNKNILYSYDYFNDESYSTNVQMLALIYPCLDAGNQPGVFSSYLELFIKKDVKTNILDELGSNFITPNGNSLVNRLTFTNREEAVPNKQNFFFIPVGGQSLELVSNGNFLLLGNSGTERQEKSKLEFHESEEVFIAEKGTGEVECSKYGRSLTSITALPGSALSNNLKYFIDSEKKALYDNDSRSVNLAGDAVEVKYNPINVGTIPGGSRYPIVPTLSFSQNPQLAELEKLLVKLRVKSFTASENAVTGLQDKNYVTPQGFLRAGQTLDFINASAEIDEKGISQSLQFKVDNVGITSDFSLSLSREDVFFVLSPSMLKARPEKVSVTFKIRGFTVELKEFNIPAADLKNDTFIIFKFSRYSFSELLEDSAKWSNYGNYKLNSAVVSGLIQAIKGKIKFPATPDYEYFNNTISKDPNWNGVLILNIPIGDGIPDVFNGLAASQDKKAHDTAAEPPVNKPGEQRQFHEGLKFQYVAFPVNRTGIVDGVIRISSTSFYGVIDYDLLGEDKKDYSIVSAHFPKEKDKIETYQFLLTKLLVRFENSSIKNFQSFAFLQLPDIFDNKVEFGLFPLSHAEQNPVGDNKDNLVRLRGNYQKNSAGQDEFNFFGQSNLIINFEDGNILRNITVSKLAFSYSKGTEEFRFDINAKAGLSAWANSEFMSIDDLEFQNIGFKFNLEKIKLPSIKFDLSKLLVFPKINFDGNGFLRSFPIKFSHFNTFKLPKIRVGEGFDLGDPDFDFFKVKYEKPKGIKDWSFDFANLFSFVFDFDLGTLGNLGALKALKGQLLVGWSFKGGFAIGFKLAGPSSDGLHLNLFGALKIDIEEVAFGKFKPKGVNDCTAYFLRLNDARLTIFGKQIPGEKNTFNGLIIADFTKPEKKIAWLITYEKNEGNKLILGAGQRVGPPIDENVKSTVTAIEATRNAFKVKLKGIDGCTDPEFYNKLNFRPERNWLIASEAILPEDWPIEIKFIFNDPVLYGIYLGFKGELLKGFSIDILYKKISDNLGVYSTEIQLPDSLRNQEMGGAFIRLPNIGIEIYTNGDWKADIGFPRNSNDWSRSGFIQFRSAPPFVGFFGFYIMQSKVASLTLFKGYISDEFSMRQLKIIQVGFALRVGIGYYLDKGILYVGASITVYGILEGAFAFERQKGLAKIFPDHFAIFGRIGAIAELVGYVDFGIIKASVYISLRAEFGMLLVYLTRAGSEYILRDPNKPDTPANRILFGINPGQSKGLQPVIVHIEGEVRVEVSIKIGCVKIHLRFRMFLRFEYTIGGGSSTSRSSLMEFTSLTLPASFSEAAVAVIPVEITGIKKIPLVYLPAFSKVYEEGKEQLVMLHSFMIPFFGKGMKGDNIEFSDNNIVKDRIVKPFLQELIQQLEQNNIVNPDRYETLRSVLLNGYCERGNGERVRIDVSIKGYLPAFINGINTTDKEVMDAILKKHFEFKDEELKPANAGSSIMTAYSKELMVIPAPVAAQVIIVDQEDHTVHQSSPDGFRIRVEGLVNNESGNPVVETQIKTIKDYDDTTLDWIKRYYDDYKTQFVNREKGLGQVSFDNKDLREKVVIPEFFKLAVLLILDAFHTQTRPKEKEREEYNPQIRIGNDGHFIYNGTGNWDPNKGIEQVIGQLNYFYNSGLRLPYEDNNTSTKAIYELLEQRVPIKTIANPVNNQIRISIDDREITADVFADDNAKDEMTGFINRFTNNFSLDELKKDFASEKPIQFTRPFDLLPVTLAVQNRKMDEENKFRFFEIPAKLSQHTQRNTRYAFELNYARYEDDNILFSSNKPDTPKFSPVRCLNIEIKVRKQTEKVLEIVNVFARNLNLMNAVFNDNYEIKAIDLYYKQDSDSSEPGATIKLEKLINSFTTILKTNLSPRTSPPLFESEQMEFTEAGAEKEREFWDDSNNPNKKNFIRLVWEALTTNNGGYYFILDKKAEFPKDASGKETTNATVILILSGDQTKVPAYFNTIKLPTDQVLLEGLNDRSHYLFIDSIRLTNSQVADKEVLEYHSLLPAHTFGFEIERKRKNNSNDNYQNYIPLEFSLSQSGGKPILSVDKVLPIMPAGKETGILKYSHLSPLIIQDKETDPVGKNIQRYTAVGKKYKLGFNLRDVFGGRTSMPGTFIATAEYQHFYFDKIIPADSWPLIRFSYWFGEFKSGKIFFNLSCKCDIREILDMAGIQREPGGKYRYELKQEINKSNSGDTKTDIDRLKELIPGMLNNLYTILAQLSDSNLKASINAKEATAEKEKWKLKVESLVEKLTQIITPKAGKYFMPDTNVLLTQDYPIEIGTGNRLKNELHIRIGFSRFTNAIHQADDTAFRKKNAKDPSLANLTDPYIWDYDTTYRSITRVGPLNPVANEPDGPKLSELNKVIRESTNQQFCLGISSEEQFDPGTNQKLNEKVTYLINEAGLASIKFDNVNENKEFSKNCYFGIRPVNNKLWSGEYSPRAAGLTQGTFSNIDLDKSLKLLLEKIDQILEAKKLTGEIDNSDADSLDAKKLFNKLIAAKKSLVNERLKQYLAWAMDDTTKPQPGDRMVKEFRDLLLSGLTNFYNYDGVVKTTVTGLEILGDEHRLSVNLSSAKDTDPVPQYNLVASKLSTKHKEWYILFDQKENISGGINFQVEPKITHIEFDIRETEQSEIQQSTWIQLITPIGLRDNKYFVKDWPKIIREFPDKPVIIRHAADQKYPDGHKEVENWNINKIGLWNYELEVKDSYKEGDIIHTDLFIEVSSGAIAFESDAPNFEGFIAYWAHKILANEFDKIWKQFIDDLSLLFSATGLSENSNFAGELKHYSFELHKNKDGWQIKNVSNGIKVTNPDKSKAAALVGPLNIFDKSNRVISVLPKLKVFRNREVKNSVFIYETETVEATNAARPHIRYYAPIALSPGDTFEKNVFGTTNQPVIPKELALKATAKYLIDTAGKDAQNKNRFPGIIKILPVIPVHQIECRQAARPAKSDALFDAFDRKNGFHSFALTVYSEGTDETDLPVFYADTIFKPK